MQGDPEREQLRVSHSPPPEREGVHHELSLSTGQTIMTTIKELLFHPVNELIYEIISVGCILPFLPAAGGLRLSWMLEGLRTYRELFVQLINNFYGRFTLCSSEILIFSS